MVFDTVTVEQMREYDKYTIDNFCPSKTLMLRAAKGIYDSVDWNGKSTAVVCGSGNNAGDGYALAGLIKDAGGDVVIIRTGEKFSEDGRYYYDTAIKKGINDIILSENTDLSEYDILVDCLLGTGFCGEVRGNILCAIEKINASSSYVVSADINSGMNGDTGEGSDIVKSDITVSIGFVKTGMITDNAKRYIAKLVNVDIGIKKRSE